MADNRTISVGGGRSNGTVTVRNQTGGMQGYGGTAGTYNPQMTFSPQNTAPGTMLQNTANPQKTWNPQTQGIINSVAQSTASTNQSMMDWQNFLKSLYAPPKQAQAAVYDVAGANARARAAAEASQNPLYSKYLNDFLTNAKLQQKQEEQKSQMMNKALETTLAQTQEDTATGRARTAEDVATNVGQINTAADEFQTDTGTQDAINRIVQAREIAKSGSTGGLGAQQVEAAQANRNTSEKRQMADFQAKKVEQELFKARTFEDLAKTDIRAISAEKTGKEKVKFDLDSYISQYGVGADIKSSGYQIRAKADEIEQGRQEAIRQDEADYGRKFFEQFISNLSDPATILATRQKYGGAY
jgi:hypothetical protein